jgi:hypothetical protein
MEKKLYLVETISFFRQRYVIEALEASHAEDEVVMTMHDGSITEFSQKHIDENITSTREISVDEYLKLFDQDNDYLSNWSVSQKMQSINTIKYDDEKDEKNSNHW